MAIYWKQNRFKAKAEDAYNEIMTLSEITAQNVVDLARNESSVIHDDFEWDNEIAGDKWRCHQARILIDNLVIKVEEPKKSEPTMIRVLHTTPDRNDYKPIEFYIKNTEEHEKLLSMAKRDLQSFKTKYYSLEELKGVFEAIDNL